MRRFWSLHAKKIELYCTYLQWRKNLEMFGICAQVCTHNRARKVCLVPSIFRLAHADRNLSWFRPDHSSTTQCSSHCSRGTLNCCVPYLTPLLMLIVMLVAWPGPSFRLRCSHCLGRQFCDSLMLTGICRGLGRNFHPRYALHTVEEAL